MNLNNLQDLITNKRFFVVAAVLLIFLVVLMFMTIANNKPVPVSQIAPTAGWVTERSVSSNALPAPTQSVELKKAIVAQMKVDQDYAGWEQNVRDTYPWRKKMPLTSEKYYVYFDLSKKIFIGRLYLSSADNTDAIKSEILQILKQEKGVPVENFNFEWEVFPK